MATSSPCDRSRPRVGTPGAAHPCRQTGRPAAPLAPTPPAQGDVLRPASWLVPGGCSRATPSPGRGRSSTAGSGAMLGGGEQLVASVRERRRVRLGRQPLIQRRGHRGPSRCGRPSQAERTAMMARTSAGDASARCWLLGSACSSRWWCRSPACTTVPGIGLLLDPCQEGLCAQAHGVGGERRQQNRYGLGPSRVGLAGQRLSGTPRGMGVFPRPRGGLEPGGTPPRLPPCAHGSSSGPSPGPVALAL